MEKENLEWDETSNMPTFRYEMKRDGKAVLKYNKLEDKDIWWCNISFRLEEEGSEQKNSIYFAHYKKIQVTVEEPDDFRKEALDVVIENPYLQIKCGEEYTEIKRDKKEVTYLFKIQEMTYVPTIHFENEEVKEGEIVEEYNING
jgi:hypothetical protein